ncbi:hypothetical protein HMPREF1531_02176 [Propionibacterium sp. oral taxon 192 str. F0372]|uniref:HIT family protein n=1 Tax=Propionibacterium sp. oral taxon 192 TaxID=671222 RepID=UPI000352E9C5|nr:HIT domain-containing protein [Propionibacterium sp. oral taxon 192]EPH02864.1 hypothetical protein HMPREF1531_02176 [Propionibacterium sp. oral taxon 192 str. F0372]
MADFIPVDEFEDHPGIPDGLQRLWTPHRLAYISGENRPTEHNDVRCPFCVSPTHDDAEALIVARGEHVFAVLNLYPYNPGHLLICPYRHVAAYIDATEEEAAEMTAFTRKAIRMISAVSQPAGFNLGMNQGSIAGAGIAAHLHQHVVPRWAGDSNFLPIIGQTKAVPFLLGQTREIFAGAWDEA